MLKTACKHLPLGQPLFALVITDPRNLIINKILKNLGIDLASGSTPGWSSLLIVVFRNRSRCSSTSGWSYGPKFCILNSQYCLWFLLLFACLCIFRIYLCSGFKILLKFFCINLTESVNQIRIGFAVFFLAFLFMILQVFIRTL